MNHFVFVDFATVPVTSPVDTTLFKVGLAPKQSGHHFFNKGFAQGYLIDGAVKEGLQLVAGKTYIFQSNVSCFHPVKPIGTCS